MRVQVPPWAQKNEVNFGNRAANCLRSKQELGLGEGVGKREFPVEEGSDRRECWKTAGFQVSLALGTKKDQHQAGLFYMLSFEFLKLNKV